MSEIDKEERSLWLKIVKFFKSKDRKGASLRAMDRQDNGNRYRWLMLRRVLLASVLIAAPWYEVFHHNHAHVVTVHEQAQKANLLSYSDFIKKADAHELSKVAIIEDENWQLVVAQDKKGKKSEVLIPTNYDITKKMAADGVDVSFTTPESLAKHGFFHNKLVAQILNTLFVVAAEIAAMGLAFVLFNRFMSRGKIKPLKPNKNLSLNDVAGIDDIRHELNEIVDFAKHNDQYEFNNAETPRGWLFVGPPGTGKTLTAEAIAAEAGIAYLKTSGSFFVEMYVGLGARRVRDLRAAGLRMAKRTGKPVIIFIDEVDAIAGSRGQQNSHSEKDQTLNELLVAANGQSQSEPLIWIAATNRPEILDPAFMRRFDKRIFFSNPDITQREQLLNIAMRKKGVSLDDESTHKIAASTVGFSGDALAKLVNDACLEATRRRSHEIDASDFHRAMDRRIMGVPRSVRLGKMSHAEKLRTAQHEAGHALVATVLAECHPVYKATIVPHGSAQGEALGMVVSRPERDVYSYTQEMMMADLTKIMAGHAAEFVANGKNKAKVSSGPSGDIIQATNLAYQMASTYGMGKTGFIALSSISMPSQAMLERMENDATMFIANAQVEAVALIEGHKNAWLALTEALMEKETLSGEEIVTIIEDNLSRR